MTSSPSHRDGGGATLARLIFFSASAVPFLRRCRPGPRCLRLGRGLPGFPHGTFGGSEQPTYEAAGDQPGPIISALLCPRLGSRSQLGGGTARRQALSRSRQGRGLNSERRVLRSIFPCPSPGRMQPRVSFTRLPMWNRQCDRGLISASTKWRRRPCLGELAIPTVYSPVGRQDIPIAFPRHGCSIVHHLDGNLWIVGTISRPRT